MRRTIIGFSIILVLANTAGALTLNESIDLALRQNPAVREAYQGTAQAAGKLSQAATSFLPSLKLDGSMGKSYSQPQTMQIAPGTYMTFGTSDQADISRYNLTLSQPVFVAALLPGYGLARKNYDLARENLRKVAQETVYNTIVAYANVIRAQKLAGLSEQSLNMAKSHLNQAQIMFNAGVTPKADLLRNQVQVLNAEVALTKARSGLYIAESSFNNVLGRSPGQAAEVDEKELGHTPPPPPDYEKLISEMFKSRPDWQQLILSEEMAKDYLTVAKTEYFPSFMLVGNYGNTKTEYPSYKSDVNSWTAVVSGSWSLFNLPTAGKVAEAQAGLAAQLARRENVKNGLELELRSAYYELKSALETIELTKKALEYAEENYKVSEMRYKTGAGTNLDSLDAQVSLTQARINDLQAKFDLEIARAKINKVVGKEVL
jgi:outer membrane protein TolC